MIELLRAIFVAEHFRVTTAVDGDEAIRRALADRPDLVVLDVRLPKRNGFEVCDYLRHDPEDPHVPILFVATAVDAEVRIEGLSRGGDDFLGKPFTPRELVARARRLLARSAESRAQRRRAGTLEHELANAQDETRRVHRELTRERRMRDLAFGIGRDLQAILDLDALAERTLALATRQLGCAAAALLTDEEGAGAFVPTAFRGTGAARFAGVAIPARGEMAAMLAGLGRPVLVHELERWPGARAEGASLSGAGIALLAPLRGPHGVEGVIVAEERTDGAPWTPEDREALGALCELSATAHVSARRHRAVVDELLERTAERARSHPHPRASLALSESMRIAESAALELGLPARTRALLRLAVSFGPWAWGEEGRESFRALESLDASCRVETLRRFVERGETLDLADLADAETRTAVAVAGVCVRHQVGRRSGRSFAESWNTALAWAGAALDPNAASALDAAMRAARGSGDAPRAA